MILREALLSARERLRAAGSEEPAIEAEVLLRFVLNLDRATFLRLLPEPLSLAEDQAFERVLSRRIEGEPAAYITGEREFRSLSFRVTPAVLIPRPETELLVEAALEIAEAWAQSDEDDGGRTAGPAIVDVGTGSGAIAVSLAVALPSALIYATDLSGEALGVARENAARHGVDRRIVFRRGDLLEPLDTTVDVIAANLPYVTEGDWQRLPHTIRDHEPRLALASGADGLQAIRMLLRQAPSYLKRGGSVLLEFGIGQSNAIEDLAREAFPGASVEIRPDFAAIPRLLIVRTYLEHK